MNDKPSLKSKTRRNKMNNTPSWKQIEYANALLVKLGYDRDNYDIESMTKKELSELIHELKDEYYAH